MATTHRKILSPAGNRFTSCWKYAYSMVNEKENPIYIGKRKSTLSDAKSFDVESDSLHIKFVYRCSKCLHNYVSVKASESYRIIWTAKTSTPSTRPSTAEPPRPWGQQKDLRPQKQGRRSFFIRSAVPPRLRPAPLPDTSSQAVTGQARRVFLRPRAPGRLSPAFLRKGLAAKALLSGADAVGFFPSTPVNGIECIILFLILFCQSLLLPILIRNVLFVVFV